MADYNAALAIAPGDRVATIGLGRAVAATGKTNQAIAIYRDITNRYPDPVALAALGDLLGQKGDAEASKDAYAVVEATATLAKINKQIYNRQLVLFYANHGRKVNEAVRLAEAELRERKDVYGYDALAWALYKRGDYRAAVGNATQALRLGTPDASILYHAGMIAAAAGEKQVASDRLRRALALSPEFDPVQASVARAQLVQLNIGK